MSNYFTTPPINQEQVTQAGNTLKQIGLFNGDVNSQTEVREALNSIKTKLQASPALVPNEIYASLSNLIVGQMTLEQFEFDNEVSRLFTKMLFAFGDLFQFNSINLPDSAPFNPTQWNPIDGQTYQPQMAQQYIGTTLVRKIEYSQELNIILGAFIDEIQFNSFMSVYMGKPVKRMELDFFNAIVGAFPSLCKKADGTDNPTQIVSIPLADQADAKLFLPYIWNTAYEMLLPSTKFNGLGYNACSTRKKLILVINSKYLTISQFTAYATLFHQEAVNVKGITKDIVWLTPELIGENVIAYLMDVDALQNIPRFEGAFSQFYPEKKTLLYVWHYWARIGVVNSQNVVRFIASTATADKAKLLPTHPAVVEAMKLIQASEKKYLPLLT